MAAQTFTTFLPTVRFIVGESGDTVFHVARSEAERAFLPSGDFFFCPTRELVKEQTPSVTGNNPNPQKPAQRLGVCDKLIISRLELPLFVEAANKVLRDPPELGYLTISNALQWRLQYNRVIQQAGLVSGVENL